MCSNSGITLVFRKFSRLSRAFAASWVHCAFTGIRSSTGSSFRTAEPTFPSRSLMLAVRLPETDCHQSRGTRAEGPQQQSRAIRRPWIPEALSERGMPQQLRRFQRRTEVLQPLLHHWNCDRKTRASSAISRNRRISDSESPLGWSIGITPRTFTYRISPTTIPSVRTARRKSVNEYTVPGLMVLRPCGRDSRATHRDNPPK